VVVSEESGIISIAHNGRMVRHLDERRLRRILRDLLQPQFPGNGLTHWLQGRESRDDKGSGKESAAV
jgi:hypothetical protein